MKRREKSAGLVSMSLVLALGLAACDDGSKQRAAEEARAQAEATMNAQKLKQGAERNVECLSALRWQKAALTAAGAGDLKIYEDYYREKLDKALGSEIVPREEGGAPTLSRANTQDYIDWAYTNDVNTKFAAGKDDNNDGVVSAAEHSGRGFDTVTRCVLEAAEMGKGPLAGKDKIARVSRLESIRKALKDKGV